MTAVSAGLIIGTGLKLAPSLRNNPLGLSLCLWLVVGTFVLVAILRWPLLWAMPGMGLPACYLVWFLLKKRAT
jgi:chromate transporter